MSVIDMKGITKRFGDLTANDQVDFSVREGEIHSLLGENGAGKTTLMKILFGMLRPDEGTIVVKGREGLLTPASAIRRGLAMVHQHFMLFNPLTVAENIVLGHEPTKVFLRKKTIEGQVASLARQYGFKMQPGIRIEDLPLGTRQRVEILKALYWGADILILDEPTAVLTPPEVDELFENLRRLREAGKTVVIITHKLKETMALSDRVTILRQGKTVSVLDTKETSPEELARLMVGRDIRFDAFPAVESTQPVKLQLIDVSLRAHADIGLRHVDLQVRAGEILGVAGVDGNGQRELASVLVGLGVPERGAVILNDREVTRQSARKRYSQGLGFIPEDRMDGGLVSGFTVAENLILGYHRLAQFGGNRLNQPAIRAFAEGLIRDFDIRGAQPDTLIDRLSGGNQQKVMLARVFAQNPDVVVIAQPTRGVDVGAIEAIHDHVFALKQAGKAILIISADLDEIMKLSDRVAVLFEGRIVACRQRSDWSEENLGLSMAGRLVDSKEVISA